MTLKYVSSIYNFIIFSKIWQYEKFSFIQHCSATYLQLAKPQHSMLMKKIVNKVQWVIRQKYRKELSSKNRPTESIVEALAGDCGMIGRNCYHCETMIKE